MKKKLMYEVPEVELIELKLESFLMNSGENTDTPEDGGDEDF